MSSIILWSNNRIQALDKAVQQAVLEGFQARRSERWWTGIGNENWQRRALAMICSFLCYSVPCKPDCVAALYPGMPWRCTMHHSHASKPPASRRSQERQVLIEDYCCRSDASFAAGQFPAKKEFQETSASIRNTHLPGAIKWSNLVFSQPFDAKFNPLSPESIKVAVRPLHLWGGILPWRHEVQTCTLLTSAELLVPQL